MSKTPPSLIVTTLDEWRALPEIAFPGVAETSATGSIYALRKVGFLAVPEAQCPPDLREALAVGDKRLLPTTVIEFDGGLQLCRLPIELSPWARQCVELAHSGMNPFPSRVEFGRLKGRAYAEIL